MMFLLGCVEYGVETTDTGKNAGAHPDIEVGVQAVAFSTINPGAIEQRGVPIKNAGTADLHISGFGVLGSTAFTPLPAEDAPTLAPMEEMDLVVEFSGDAAEENGTLLIWSDDADTPEVSVALSGSTFVAELIATPSPADLGAATPLCPASKTITVQNVGLAAAEVSALMVTGEFTLSHDAVPLSLEPGASLLVDVAHEYSGGGSSGGTLAVLSDAPEEVVEVPLFADEDDDGVFQDIFVQGDGPWELVDLVFYVDQSGSMSDEQAQLADNVAYFSAALQSMALDWQMIVVTRDQGCFNGEIFTPESADLETGFLAAVQGGGGANTEAGLSIASAAATASCNRDVFRGDESKAHFILISDEPEQSSSPPEALVDRIHDALPNAAISVIVGDAPAGCPGAFNGDGYHEAAVLTGGLDSSICDSDWSGALADIATLSSQGTTDTFVLSNEADPDTIEVAVDSVAVHDWTYDATSQAIVFDADAIPAPSSRIVVDYALPSVCD